MSLKNRLAALESKDGCGANDFAETLVAARERRQCQDAENTLIARIGIAVAKRAEGKPLNAFDRARLRVYDARRGD